MLYSKSSLTPWMSTHSGIILPFTQIHCKVVIVVLALLVIWEFLRLQCYTTSITLSLETLSQITRFITNVNLIFGLFIILLQECYK